MAPMQMLRGAAVASLALAACPSHGLAVSQASSLNPIRKVVNLLQAMQKKVQHEGETEKDFFDKFMCYCKHGKGDLATSIGAAGDKAPAVASEIEASQGKLSQDKSDLKKAQDDRVNAKQAIAEAKSQRQKEASVFSKTKSDMDTNVAAIKKAVAALEQGAEGAFLQTSAAQLLRSIATKVDMLDADRQDVMAFLDQGSSYAPRSGSITGILKQMGDTMAKDLADVESQEAADIKDFEALVGSKTKEVGALTARVEAKTTRIGELGVQIVEMKDDLSDTAAALIKDQKFLAELEKGCATKQQEWDARSKTRAEELVALAETVKVLNDDESLDLFKDTLPARGASFIQVAAGQKEVRAAALAAVRSAAQKAGSSTRPGIDLLALALSGKASGKGGFDKVLKMVDDMVDVLGEEQGADDKKKEYCAGAFDKSDDEKKALERTNGQLEAAIADGQDQVKTLQAESAALADGINKLDKSVVDATEQRKEENAAYKELLASNTAAKKLLGIAVNNLRKFYDPALYKAPEKRELSRDDRIAVNFGGEAPPTQAPGGIAGTGVTVFAQSAPVLAQVAMHSQRSMSVDAPAPPPETWGAYQKKSQGSNGVMAMIDLLVKDLDKELQEGKVDEEQAQRDYEELSADAAEKREADSKSIAQKESARADLQGALEGHHEDKASTVKELMATEELIHSLHTECDWLVQHFDIRKEARAGEVDSLKRAKAVLGGAEYSFIQKGSTRGLFARRG